MVGVGGSQIVSIVALMIYTRLYETEQIGLMGTYFSFVVIFRLLANGGYEPAIVTPKKEDDAIHVLQLCFLISVGISIFLLIVFALLFRPSMAYLGIDVTGFEYIIYLIPISVFLEGIAQALKYWLNRQQAYSLISKARFIQAIVTAVLSIVLFYFGYFWTGMIWGIVIGELIFSLLLFNGSKLVDFFQFNFSAIQKQAYYFRQFPQYGLGGSWLNSIGSELPFMILPIYFGGQVVGFYKTCHKVLFSAINLVGSSVSTVYYQAANQAYLNGGNELAQLTKTTLRSMLVLSVPPTLLLMAFGPFLFEWVFGEGYAIAGEYARWLAPWVLIKFLNHPLTYLIDIKMKLKAQLWYNIAISFAQFGVLAGVGWIASAPTTIAYFGIVGFVVCVIYLIYLLKLSEILD